ncbi:MAG: GTPase [Candidatus Latescibacterota bacterium]
MATNEKDVKEAEVKMDEAAVDAEIVEESPDETATPEEKAEKIVRNHMLVALGTGIVPPIIDIVALSGVQIRMLYLLAKNYNLSFNNEWGKSVIGTFIGGYGMAKLATGAVYSLMKFIPGIGQIAAPVSLSVVASASTYALGKVFVKHFESGGTLLDFDPEKMRKYYYEEYEKGVKIAKEQTAEKKADK